MTQDDDWSARMARLVAREVRRYRESQQPRMSVQRLSDRTAEAGMLIPRSVLANLESGRRETVSVAEILVLAAALNVAPIELICPVGYDKETEILPGRMIEPLNAMRWFTGELKMETAEGVTTLRQPARSEQSSTYLLEYHEQLINRLRTREAEAAMAIADAEAARERAIQAAEVVDLAAAVRADAAFADADAAAAASAEATHAAVQADVRLADAATARAAADGELARADADAHFRMTNLTEWRDFIREPLRQTRAEMRRRGMMLPDLPTDIQLGLDEDD